MKYALDQNQTLVYLTNATQARALQAQGKHRFFCPDCGQQLKICYSKNDYPYFAHQPRWVKIIRKVSYMCGGRQFYTRPYRH
ncbi:DUF7830 domain-containing protein [Agrilactobacillus composti]|uniref:DUF7830 domain-containing protein n=1 Tax=Agrilactobacillus composti TaxID=398555 RepID=UPI001268D7CC